MESLTSKYAFSLKEQPYLRDLFQVVAYSDTPVTFIVGAGVSRDASLPSWPELINKICQQIGSSGRPEDRILQELAMSDPVEMTRKAEFVIQMAREASKPKKTPIEVIRHALYSGSDHVTPGPLADALARTSASLGKTKRARIITTNFDGILEAALDKYVRKTKPVGLVAEELGEEWSKSNKVGDVLHVHGMLGIGDEDPIEPIVLSESDFLKSGPSVRELIKKQLQKTCVIFVGVSVTDPNLTGPLWDIKDSIKDHTLRPFVLMVPEAIKNYEDRDSKRYALKKAEYLEQKLNMRPIVLKSFSQLTQVFWELDLALTFPEEYLMNSKEPACLKYGIRFTRQLDDCYSHLDSDRRADTLTGEAAQKLSDRLHYSLEKGHSIGKLLNNFIAEHKDSGEYDVNGPKERFGLFLWLRARKHGSRSAPYALNLIGSSTWIHREPQWSGTKNVEIVANSTYPVIQAMFQGKALYGNVSATSPYYIWRGTYAVPVRIEKGADILTIGAISLNTTRYVEESEDAGKKEEPMSILSLLLPEEHQKLRKLMEKVAREVVGQ
ncbi:SIR2 family protein [Streptomyces sp. NPDC006265]|uniref:SIR2 family protein n=1 Tax=Streptomyces sp. NPDC006265 TaxID=3156740 RepID=UPI0033B8EED4